MNWKRFGRKQSHVIEMLAWYLARRTEGFNEVLTHDNQCPGRDSNQALFQHSS